MRINTIKIFIFYLLIILVNNVNALLKYSSGIILEKDISASSASLSNLGNVISEGSKYRKEEPCSY